MLAKPQAAEEVNPMSDAPERPVDYKPEEGAEVRPARRRYTVDAIDPGGLEALTVTHEVTVPYRTMSLLAIGAFVVALCYAAMVALGGVVSFWDRAPKLLIGGSVLVPLLSLPVALRFNIRDAFGLARFAGLALLVFWAVPVGVGGLIAFPGRTPWLLPLWTVAIPLAAAACALAARWRIQTSEDTLSGKALTTWAAGLS